MCISISSISLGDDVQQIYKTKKESGYSFEKLPKNKNFHNFFHLSKDDVSFFIGSNNNNQTSMFTYTETIPKDNIEKKYIGYLELFFSYGYKPIPESIKNDLKSDNELKFLNGASNSSGDLVLIGTMPDPKNEQNLIWISIVMSTRLLGYTKHSGTNYKTTKEPVNNINVWEIIGGASAIASLFSIF